MIESLITVIRCWKYHSSMCQAAPLSNFFSFPRLMISFTNDPTRYAWEGYLYSVLLLVVAILQSLLLQQYFQRCFVLGMKVRTALIAAVYKKVKTGVTAQLHFLT